MKNNLKDELIAAAQESLKLYGTAIPPAGEKQRAAASPKSKKLPSKKDAFLALTQESIEQFHEALPPLWAMLPTLRRYCAHCEGIFLVEQHYGTRVINGTTKIQSPCRKVRNSKESHPSRFGMPLKKRPKTRGPYSKLL